MKSRTAVFQLTDKFTSQMDAIRKVGFPPTGGIKTLEDEFDQKGLCVHLYLQLEGEIAIYHRFTNNLGGKKLVMQHWTNDKAPVPKDDPCMEMGRFVIAPQFRQIPGLFDAFILTGLMYAQKAGYTKVATMIKDERSLIERCIKLGFEPQDLTTDCHVPNSGTIKARTLIYHLEGKEARLGTLFWNAAIQLENKQIKLNREFLKRITPIVTPSKPSIRAKL